jgi:hypothetical protein
MLSHTYGQPPTRPVFTIDDANGQIDEIGTIFLTMRYGSSIEEIGQYNYLQEAVIALKAVKCALAMIERGTGYVAPSYQSPGLGEQAQSVSGCTTTSPKASEWLSAPAGSRTPSHLDAVEDGVHPIADRNDLHCNASQKTAMDVFEGNEAQVLEHNRRVFAISMLGEEKWNKWVNESEGLVHEYLHGSLTFDELKRIKEPPVGHVERGGYTPVNPDGDVPPFVDAYMSINRPNAYKDYHAGTMVRSSYLFMYNSVRFPAQKISNGWENFDGKEPMMGDG